MLEALGFGVDDLSRTAERRGIDLVLFTFDREYYEYRLALHGHVQVVDVDTFDIDAVRAALDKFDRVDGLISNTDTWATVAETLAVERGFPNVARNTALLRDKVWVRNTLYAHGLSSQRAFRASEWMSAPPQETPQSCIVKDAGGSSSKNVGFAKSTAETENLIQQLVADGLHPDQITIEPYFRGPMYSAETYTTATGTTLFGVTSRTISELPDFRELDTSYPIGKGTPWEARVNAWVSKIIEVIGRGTGPSHIEFVDTGSGFEVVEINCRLGGFLIGHGIELVNGVSPYELLISEALTVDFTDAAMTTATRSPRAEAFAQVAKYADRLGKIGEVSGVDDAELFPGNVAWGPILQPSADITSVRDQRAAYGLVTAQGADAAEALSRAHAAARHVRIASH